MRILVVDDDPTIRALLVGELEAAGYDVDVAVDGVEALELLGRSVPDGVILDVMMPRTGGWEVLSSLRADPAMLRLPVFMLSGRVLHDDVRHGYELGATVVLPKPLAIDELLSLLAALVGLPDGASAPH